MRFLLVALALCGAWGSPAHADNKAPASPYPKDGASCLSTANPPDNYASWPAGWSMRRRIVHIAVCEWAKFKLPVVEILREADPGADDPPPPSLALELGVRAEMIPFVTRIPMTGPNGKRDLTNVNRNLVLERQVRFGATEEEGGVNGRLRAYWASTPQSYPGIESPWSAAFISYVYRTAGLDFPASNGHFRYLRALMSRPIPALRVVDPDQQQPVPGDLACFARNKGQNPFDYRELLRVHRALSPQPENMLSGDSLEMHCDLIVRVNANESVVLIGGNVKNSVTASIVRLHNGRLERNNARPWSAIVHIDEPEDRCATIEATHLDFWQADARTRALDEIGCASS